MSSLPVFPQGIKGGKKRKMHTEAPIQAVFETGQTTAQSQNMHKKIQQQSKPMAGKGRGMPGKETLEGLEDTRSMVLASHFYLDVGHNLSKITPLVLGGRGIRIMTLCR